MTQQKPSVYLAGPITGLTYQAAQNWRNIVASLLSPEIDAFSPLRGKQELARAGIIEDCYDANPLTSEKGITMRDYYDCMNRDAILVNFLGATRISMGTVMEVAWGFAHHKLVVIAMESGNVHEHSMIRHCAGFRTSTLAEAVKIVRSLLLPR